MIYGGFRKPALPLLPRQILDFVGQNQCSSQTLPSGFCKASCSAQRRVRCKAKGFPFWKTCGWGNTCQLWELRGWGPLFCRLALRLAHSVSPWATQGWGLPWEQGALTGGEIQNWKAESAFNPTVKGVKRNLAGKGPLSVAPLRPIPTWSGSFLNWNSTPAYGHISHCHLWVEGSEWCRKIFSICCPSNQKLLMWLNALCTIKKTLYQMIFLRQIVKEYKLWNDMCSRFLLEMYVNSSGRFHTILLCWE